MAEDILEAAEEILARRGSVPAWQSDLQLPAGEADHLQELFKTSVREETAKLCAEVRQAVQDELRSFISSQGRSGSEEAGVSFKTHLRSQPLKKSQSQKEKRIHSENDVAVGSTSSSVNFVSESANEYISADEANQPGGTLGMPAAAQYSHSASDSSTYGAVTTDRTVGREGTTKSWAVAGSSDDDQDVDRDRSIKGQTSEHVMPVARRALGSGCSAVSAVSTLSILDQDSEEEAERDKALLFDQHYSVGFLSGMANKEKAISAARHSMTINDYDNNKLHHMDNHRQSKGSEASHSLGGFFHMRASTKSSKSEPGRSVMPMKKNHSLDSRSSKGSLDPVLPNVQPSRKTASSSATDAASEDSGDTPQTQQGRASNPSIPDVHVQTKHNRFSVEYAITATTTKADSMNRRLEYIVTSNGFDYLVGALVVLNAASIGAQVDWQARNWNDETPVTFVVINWIFCLLFTTELVMRIFTFGRKFFVNHEWKWNLFDTVIVVFQLAEEFLTVLLVKIFGSDSGTKNLTVLRVLRILRLVRIMRFLRILRLIRELHTMVGSILASLRSFFWTVALLFGLIYVVGVYITQMVADHMYQHPTAALEDPALARYYGSLGNCVLSLFQALSGGVDWEDVVVPLHPVDAPGGKIGIVLFYSAYIAFSMFVMLNLVTGIFVDSAQTNIREDRDLDLINRVHELFITADDDHSGRISWIEFAKQLENPEMVEYFKSIDLDMSEAEHLFELLDVHNIGAITSEEFVNGCLRMRGPARAYDVASHARWQRRVTQRMLSGIRQVEHLTKLLSEEFLETGAMTALQELAQSNRSSVAHLEDSVSGVQSSHTAKKALAAQTSKQDYAKT